jgi:hypothetical protein
MLELIKRRNVDLLIEQFWKKGYLTISRKYGTYLPEPSKVGGFDVDIVAKYKKNYAIGITLTNADLNDHKLVEKLNFLGTRQTKYTNKRVLLFIGVPINFYNNARILIDKLENEAKKNVRLFSINDKPILQRRTVKDSEKILFA